MRRTVLIVMTLSAALVLPACRGTQSRSNFTPVAIRFATPPDALAASGDMTGVARASYDGFDDSRRSETVPADAFHVALWGGPFDGHNVTYGVTSLAPGTYTFAFVDRKQEDMIQGWMSIHPEGHDLLTYLQRWKNGIPALKQQLAYDYEITGKMQNADAEAFDSFSKQLKAYEDLENRLARAIAAETSANSRRAQQVRDLFRSAEIRLLPGREEVFQPATRAAFNEEDLQAIHGGGALTKIILAADYDMAQWKLDRVNALYGDLQRVKAVAEQEADRLERRKGLYLLTDHLHDHDQKFVQNEIRLQNSLAMIDRINAELHDLRERRMALAFIVELISPDGTFTALDHEEQQCIRERTVMETELERLQQLMNTTGAESPRRVALERSRQRVLGNVSRLDTQMTELFEAREALVTMVNSCDVIHRQGDDKLLTAIFVSTGMPFHVRRAVERESVMTIRLEARDDVFVPFKATLTGNRFPAPFGFRPDSGAPGQTGKSSITTKSGQPSPTTTPYQPKPSSTQPKEPSGWGQQPSTQNQQSSTWGQKPTTQDQPSSTPGQKSTTTSKQTTTWGHKSSEQPQPTSGWDNEPSQPEKHATGPAQQPMQWEQQPTNWESKPAKSAPSSTAGPAKAQPSSTKSAPSQSSSWSKPSQPSSTQGSKTSSFSNTTSEPQPKARRASSQASGQGGCELPLFVKLLVPPCWFLDDELQGGGSGTTAQKSSSKAHKTADRGSSKSGSKTFSPTKSADGSTMLQAQATKTYVDGFIKIEPNATNEVGKSHTFTVSVFENAGDGNGFVAAPGEQVNVSYMASNGAEDQAPNKCTTAADGTCMVSVNSRTAGKIVATATCHISVGGVTLTRTTDGSGSNSGPATKATQTADVWKPSQPSQPSKSSTPSQPSQTSKPMQASKPMQESKPTYAPAPAPAAKKVAYAPKASKSAPAPKAKRVSSTSKAGDGGCELPIFVKLFVPPCWFLDDDFQGGSSGTQAKKKSDSSSSSMAKKDSAKKGSAKKSGSPARLTSMPEDEPKQTDYRNKQTGQCDCALIKQLHGPCWTECCPNDD